MNTHKKHGPASHTLVAPRPSSPGVALDEALLSLNMYLPYPYMYLIHSLTHHFNNGQGKLCSIIDASIYR